MASKSAPRKRVLLRPAWPDEGPALSALALESKAYWGYDAAFIDQCRDELTITRERIGRERIRVAEIDGKVVGFSSVEVSVGKAEVCDLFVLPSHINRGVGQLLANEMLLYICRHGIPLVHVEADPNAMAFYARQGFIQCGEVPSHSIPGRKLPLMEMRF
ncbi:MAG: GNAT family N-acetyltransferase [Parvibaculum sp.]